jgi:hypothetical protein
MRFSWVNGLLLGLLLEYSRFTFSSEQLLLAGVLVADRSRGLENKVQAGKEHGRGEGKLCPTLDKASVPVNTLEEMSETAGAKTRPKLKRYCAMNRKCWHPFLRDD